MVHIKSRKHAARTHSCLGLAAAGLAFGAAPAFADGTSPGAGAQVLPAVHATDAQGIKADAVDSPKFTQPLLDTPQTITVITKALADQQGATTLTEALRNSPGVSTFYVGENGSTSTGDAVYMRGFDASSDIFVDGIRDLGSISRDIFDVDQVEVIKGPAGSDFGRTAPNGAINLVSKQAQLGGFSQGTVTLGDWHQQRLAADVDRQFGATSAGRLNLVVQDSDVPGRDLVANKRWGIAPSLAFGLGTSTRAVLNVLHVHQDNVPDGGVSTIGLPGYSNPDANLNGGAKVDPSNFYGTTSDYDHVDADMVTLKVEHDFGPKTVLRNTSRYGRTSEDTMLTSFMLPVAPSADPSTWTLARTLNNKNQLNKILTNQTNLSTSFEGLGAKHDLSTGVELIREEQDTQGVAGTGAWPVANLYAPDPDVTGYTRTLTAAHSNGHTYTAAAYAFDTAHFGERFLLTGGLRVDRYHTAYSNDVLCGGTAKGAIPCPAGAATGTLINAASLADERTLVGWKLGAVYKPADNGSLYLDYAVAQQPPGGTNFALSTSVNSAANPDFDPEKDATVEAGTKWELLQGALSLNGAVYRTDVSNDIESDGGTPAQYFQTGKKRVQGVELAMVGNLTRDWAVNAGFTTMDTKVVSGAAEGNDSSLALNYTPKEAFTSWTTYRLPFGLVVGGGVRYMGKLQRGHDGAVGTPAYTDAYWVADGMLEYRVNPKLDLRLNLYNLGNADYVSAINKSGYRYTPGAPRYAALTADIRF